MNAQDCIFCKIVAGHIPCKKIFEDEDFFAFHDVRPAAPVHALLIPRRHIASLSACDENDVTLLGKMMQRVPHIAALLGVADLEHETGGFRTIINTGPVSGQEVDHLHVHILGGARPWSRMN